MSELIYISEFDVINRNITIDKYSKEQAIETSIAFGQVNIKIKDLLLNDAQDFEEVEQSIVNMIYDLMFINDEDVILSDNIILINMKINTLDLIIDFKVSREMIIYDYEDNINEIQSN